VKKELREDGLAGYSSEPDAETNPKCKRSNTRKARKKSPQQTNIQKKKGAKPTGLNKGRQKFHY